jgi:glutamate dehydrogenase/leucine dehydrogenase
MAIPAALMDSVQQRKIDALEARVVKLEDKIPLLEEEIKILKKRSLPPPPKSIAQSSSES